MDGRASRSTAPRLPFFRRLRAILLVVARLSFHLPVATINAIRDRSYRPRVAIQAASATAAGMRVSRSEPSLLTLAGDDAPPEAAPRRAAGSGELAATVSSPLARDTAVNADGGSSGGGDGERKSTSVVEEASGARCRTTRRLTVSQDAEGRKTVNEYVRERVIGRGSYAKVVSVLSQTPSLHTCSLPLMLPRKLPSRLLAFAPRLLLLIPYSFPLSLLSSLPPVLSPTPPSPRRACLSLPAGSVPPCAHRPHVRAQGGRGGKGGGEVGRGRNGGGRGGNSARRREGGERGGGLERLTFIPLVRCACVRACVPMLSSPSNLHCTALHCITPPVPRPCTHFLRPFCFPGCVRAVQVCCKSRLVRVRVAPGETALMDVQREVGRREVWGRAECEVGWGEMGRRGGVGRGETGRERGGVGRGETGRERGGVGRGETGRERGGVGRGETGRERGGVGRDGGPSLPSLHALVVTPTSFLVHGTNRPCALNEFCAVPRAPCPVPRAPCPVPRAPCRAPCPVSCALCPVSHPPSPHPCALCPTSYPEPSHPCIAAPAPLPCVFSLCPGLFPFPSPTSTSLPLPLPSPPLPPVFEYLEGGPVFPEDEPLVGGVGEERARRVFRDVSAALLYVHSQGVVHNDIKPANILCTAHSAAKLADFGVCQEVACACTLCLHALLSRCLCCAAAFDGKPARLSPSASPPSLPPIPPPTLPPLSPP
ncbi:unnamed protein product [Closterium sp. NIES-53]